MGAPRRGTRAVRHRAAAVLDARARHRARGAAGLPAVRHGRARVEPAGRRLAVGQVAQGPGAAETPPRAAACPARYDLSHPATSASSTPPTRSPRSPRRPGTTLVHLAIAFVIAHPGVTSAIIGPRTMEQLTSQLGAADVDADRRRARRDRRDRPAGHEPQRRRRRLPAAGAHRRGAAPPLTTSRRPADRGPWPLSGSGVAGPAWRRLAQPRAAGSRTLRRTPPAMTSTTGTPTEADRALKARHRALWSSGDYPALAADLLPDPGPCWWRPRRRPATGCWTLAPARAMRRSRPPRPVRRDRVRPDPGPLRRRAGAGRRGARGGARVAGGRRRGAAVRRRRVRRRDVLHRRDVRAAPPGRRRRARAGVPARRHDRTAQLDARGLHRPDVRDHEAVCPAAPARCAAAAAVGRRGARARAAGRPGHRRDARNAGPSRSTGSTARGLPRLLQARYGPTIAVYKALADQPDRAAALDEELADLVRRFDRDGAVSTGSTSLLDGDPPGRGPGPR